MKEADFSCHRCCAFWTKFHRPRAKNFMFAEEIIDNCEIFLASWSLRWRFTKQNLLDNIFRIPSTNKNRATGLRLKYLCYHLTAQKTPYPILSSQPSVDPPIYLEIFSERGILFKTLDILSSNLTDTIFIAEGSRSFWTTVWGLFRCAPSNGKHWSGTFVFLNIFWHFENSSLFLTKTSTSLCCDLWTYL